MIARSPWRRPLWVVSLVSSSCLALPAAAEMTRPLLDLLESTPADSLVVPLRRLEAQKARPAEGAEAALLLGHLHFARGEYREAAAAFGRAAARLDPSRKPEARYWLGLSWLGLGEPTQARAALEEAAQSSRARRHDALVGVAQAWELAQRPERAYEVLVPLLEDDLGETGPAALERGGALAERFKHSEQARKARERLLRDYPRSIEAASARLTLAASAQRPTIGTVAVVIGEFVDRGRARSLASEAKRAGFPNAQVITRGQGLSAMHIVHLGAYTSMKEARAAGEQATRAMGVAYRVVRAE